MSVTSLTPITRVACFKISVPYQTVSVAAKRSKGCAIKKKFYVVWCSLKLHPKAGCSGFHFKDTMNMTPAGIVVGSNKVRQIPMLSSIQVLLG